MDIIYKYKSVIPMFLSSFRYGYNLILYSFTGGKSKRLIIDYAQKYL